MKKMRSLLAMLLCVVLLASTSMVASAATCTQVESVLDFTAMPRMAEDWNKADIAAKVIEAGAVACENLMVAGNYENIANPGGYQGWGYYVQKVVAAEGETIQNAKLDLGYYIITSANQGTIELYASADGSNWQMVASDSEGNGDFSTVTRKNVTVDLPFAAGQTELYIMVKMAHWDTYEGAGVAYSKLTINVPGQEPAPEQPADPLVSTLDFTAMPRMDEGTNKADTAAYVINAGAVACENLMVAGNHENIANPGGYAGWGYFIQKVSAPEGKTLDSAVLELSYRMCNGDAVGQMEVYASATPFTGSLLEDAIPGHEKIWGASEGHGDAFYDERQTVTLDLPVEEGQTEIYVMVRMRHWNTYEGAGVAYSKLSGTSNSGNPTTGDAISVIVALTLVSAAGAVITTKKFRKEEI